MKTFKQHLNEKTEYYLDTSKDNTEKYVAKDDGGFWYVGRVGMKGGSSFLKFVAAHGKDSYFERAKLKKTKIPVKDWKNDSPGLATYIKQVGKAEMRTMGTK